MATASVPLMVWRARPQRVGAFAGDWRGRALSAQGLLPRGAPLSNACSFRLVLRSSGAGAGVCCFVSPTCLNLASWCCSTVQGGRDSSGLGRSRKGVLLLAAASILLALATVTLSVRKSGPMQLLEMPWKNRVQRRVAAPAPTAAAMRPTISLANVAPARPQALLQAEPASAQMSKAGNVVYYYMPPAAKSPLHGLAAGQKLAAPAPGTYVAPMPGNELCRLWSSNAKEAGGSERQGL